MSVLEVNKVFAPVCAHVFLGRHRPRYPAGKVPVRQFQRSQTISIPRGWFSLPENVQVELHSSTQTVSESIKKPPYVRHPSTSARSAASDSPHDYFASWQIKHTHNTLICCRCLPRAPHHGLQVGRRYAFGGNVDKRGLHAHCLGRSDLRVHVNTRIGSPAAFIDLEDGEGGVWNSCLCMPDVVNPSCMYIYYNNVKS